MRRKAAPPDGRGRGFDFVALVIGPVLGLNRAKTQLRLWNDARSGLDLRISYLEEDLSSLSALASTDFQLLPASSVLERNFLISLNIFEIVIFFLRVRFQKENDQLYTHCDYTL